MVQLEIIQELFQLDHLLEQPEYNPVRSEDESSFSSRFENILNHCRTQTPQIEQTLHCIKQRTYQEKTFIAQLHEDLSATVMGIEEFVRYLDKSLLNTRKENN